MRVLVSVYFKAEGGGLHTHVAAQVKGLLTHGHEVAVLCRPGEFAGEVTAMGATALTTGFESVEQDVETVLAAGPFDLLHTHPFAARKAAVAVALRTGWPLFSTFHGTYHDEVTEWGDVAEAFVAVSGAIRDALVTGAGVEPWKVSVIPNGVSAADVPDPRSPQDAGSAGRVLVASRFDQDKTPVVDAVLGAWRSQVSTGVTREWLVLGAGEAEPTLRAAAEEVRSADGRPLVTFGGWVPEREVQLMLQQCTVAVVPGRSAMQALVAGVATIAVGSKGYLGLVDEATVMQGLYGNFGGHRGSARPISAEDLSRDLDAADVLVRDVSRTGALRGVVLAFCDQELVDRQTLALYAAAEGVVRERTLRRDVTPEELAFQAAGDPGRLARSWVLDRPELASVVPHFGGGVAVRCSMGADEFTYLRAASAPLDGWPAGQYELSVRVVDAGSRARAGVWFTLQHEGSETTRSVHLAEGDNRLAIDVDLDVTRVRVAVRLAGRGSLELGELRVRRVDRGVRRG